VVLWSSCDTALEIATYAQCGYLGIYLVSASGSAHLIEFSTTILPFSAGSNGQPLTHDQKVELLGTLWQVLAISFHSTSLLIIP
jgi:hypothetical protein